jgi:hypothetical protein
VHESTGGIERLFDRGEDAALDGKGFAGNARAGRGAVAAAAELGGDSLTFTFGFRAQADARSGPGSISSKTQATTTGSMARIWSIRPSVSRGPPRCGRNPVLEPEVGDLVVVVRRKWCKRA